MVDFSKQCKLRLAIVQCLNAFNRLNIAIYNVWSCDKSINSTNLIPFIPAEFPPYQAYLIHLLGAVLINGGISTCSDFPLLVTIWTCSFSLLHHVTRFSIFCSNLGQHTCATIKKQKQSCSSCYLSLRLNKNELKKTFG